MKLTRLIRSQSFRFLPLKRKHSANEFCFVALSDVKSNSIVNSQATVSSQETNGTSKHRNTTRADEDGASGETLDLGDLDLSQLRLTRRDLEALSNLTPNLPKHCQDQLLAQLPPTQARKLSRTLSMQATGNPSQPLVYKRSLSGGRDIPMVRDHTSAGVLSEEATDSPVPFDRSSILRRSLSRGRSANVDNGLPAIARRSMSSVRSGDLPNRLSYTGDLRSDSVSPRYRLADLAASTPTTSLRSDYYSRLPPSNAPNCLSPPPIPPSSSSEALDSPLRRRASARRTSRFLRPDFYDSSSNLATADDSTSSRLRRERERETQSVLREIRERSRDRARRDSASYLPTPISDSRPPESFENGPTPQEKEQRRKSSIPNVRATVDEQNNRIYRARNKSVERCCDVSDAPEKSNNEGATTSNRSASVSRSVPNGALQTESASDFTDKILNELVQKSQEAVAKSEAKENGASVVRKLKVKPKDGVAKPKSKARLTENEVEKACGKILVPDHVNNFDVGTVTMTLPKPASKLARPKSYAPDAKKESSPVVAIVVIDKKKGIELEDNASTNDANVELTLRPKSFPNSKLTPPKEVTSKVSKRASPAASSSSSNSSNGTKSAITAVMEKLIEKSAERLSPAKSAAAAKAKMENGDAPESPAKMTKKKVKVVKKAKPEQPAAAATDETKAKESKSESSSPTKAAKSPEKKVKSGFLYSIGQKFEKMRESSKSKEKKSAKATDSPTKTQPAEVKEPENASKNGGELQKVSLPIREESLPPVSNRCEQRKSRIDAMIRNLRERSVPQSIPADSPSPTTESALIKRAISVEDMINGSPNLHKCNVNKVLGLFRRIEREHQLQSAQNQITNSNIPTANGVDSAKERPKSGGFVSKLKKTPGRPYYTGAKSDTIVTLTDQIEKQFLADKMNQTLIPMNNSKIPTLKPAPVSHEASENANAAPNANSESKASTKCPDCGTEDCKDITSLDDGENLQSKLRRFSYNMNKLSEAPVRNQSHCEPANNRLSERERIRNNRKGLILDLNPAAFEMANTFNAINNNGYANGNGDANANNNHVTKNLNNNNTTPTCEHSANCSSDSRSMRDDCESTSTFLSPTEEPELCFDDWSVCSSSVDDHTRVSPLPPKYTPTSSRHSFQHHHHCPSTAASSASADPPSNSDSESVIDRIKRRSFYCRFNEKKPRRTSSIVGPSARDYYRDMASSRSKPHASDDSCRQLSKSPTPMNRSTESGINSPTSTLDDADHVHYHFHHTPRSLRYDRDVTPIKSSDYPNLRATLTSPPASSSKYIPKAMSTSDYLPNGNHRPYRSSVYDGITPSASSSSTSSTSPFIYGTYNPKHRVSSSYLSPSVANSNGIADYHPHHHHHPVSSSYATLGRSAKQRPYDHRSISLLDPNAMSSYGLPAKRLTAADHQHPHLRSVNDFSIGNR